MEFSLLIKTLTISTIIILILIALKIIIKFFLLATYKNLKNPVFKKPIEKEAIDFKKIAQNYFNYLSNNNSHINETSIKNKLDNYKEHNKKHIVFKIPKILDNAYLNGYNLDYILGNFWKIKRLKIKKFKFQRFIAYKAYSLFSLLFYILAFSKIFFSLLVYNHLLDNFNKDLISNINISLLVSTLCLFFIVIIILITGIFIKKHWEKMYEQQTNQFIKLYYNKHFAQYQEARLFSKAHKFSLYFKKNKRTKWKYLGPFGKTSKNIL